MILILGNPGAGKTTQTKLLAQYLNCPWFSMGDIVRHNVTGQARRDMLAGRNIGDEIIIGLVDKTLNTVDTSKEVVFEGNPRSIPQAKWWLKQAEAGRFKITGILHLVADPSVAEQRMIKRGRLDDHDDDVIEKRYAVYRKETKPTLDFLKDEGVAVHEIDGNGSVEKVASNIHRAIGV